MMVDGKKGTSQKILYGAFELVKERSGKDPLEVFEAALRKRYASTRSSCTPCRWSELPSSS